MSKFLRSKLAVWLYTARVECRQSEGSTMRKTSSAPSLVNVVNQTHSIAVEGQQQYIAARMPKSGSSGALSKLSGGYQKDGSRREGSQPSRLKDSQVRSFPLAAVDTALPLQPDPALPEQFAESARGIAGLECFELYGPHSEAPPVEVATEDGPDKPLETLEQYERNAAFASCLATPLTGEEKNLGELVDAQARQMLRAAQQSVEARYQEEVGSREEEALCQEQDILLRRKRKLAEKLRLGQDSGRGKADWKRDFKDFPEALKMLSTIVSLDSESNRIRVDENYLCIGEVCYPWIEMDENVFEALEMHGLSPRLQQASAVSQSV